MYGVHHPMSRIVDEKDTCTACGGTMIMEFAALSRLTGDSIYEVRDTLTIAHGQKSNYEDKNRFLMKFMCH